jgi:hypothetical protein
VANPKVGLYWNCLTASGWRRFPAAMGRNGKIRLQFAQVRNTQLHYPKGHYDLRHTEDRKTVWTNVGSDATEALNATNTSHYRHNLNDRGVEAVKVPFNAAQTSLRAAPSRRTCLRRDQ